MVVWSLPDVAQRYEPSGAALVFSQARLESEQVQQVEGRLAAWLMGRSTNLRRQETKCWWQSVRSSEPQRLRLASCVAIVLRAALISPCACRLPQRSSIMPCHRCGRWADRPVWVPVALDVGVPVVICLCPTCSSILEITASVSSALARDDHQLVCVPQNHSGSDLHSV